MPNSRWISLTALLFLVGGLLAVNIGADDDQVDGQADTASADSAPDPVVPELAAPPEMLGQARDLIGLDGWINTAEPGGDNTALATTSSPGPVRIVQFWTFGCYNCKNTLPHLQGIYQRWHDEGLQIIGVHAPEFSHEAEPDRIAQASVDLGVTWPVALDTDKANFRSWQGSRRFWPRTYVIDQNGQIRFDHIGEGAYTELEATVAHLIEHGA